MLVANRYRLSIFPHVRIRFWLGFMGCLLLSARSVRALQRELKVPLLTPANLLTLSRGLSAAALAGAATARRAPGSASWMGLICACTLSDWLDGPLARRSRATSLGEHLDARADAWLTLWAGLAASRLGELPVWSIAAPTARYLLADLRAGLPAGRRRHRADSGWQRAAGVLQMATLTACLSPWPRLRWLGKRAAGPAAIAQLVALSWSAWLPRG